MRGLQVLLVLLSGLGVILVLLTTQRYGAGFDPDSVEYVICARSLLAGTGFLTHEGEPFTQWPPLFPVLLAALGAVGVDLGQGSRWINALAFGLVVFTSGQLFLLHLRSRALVVLGTLSTFSFPLIIVSTYVWSEAVFIFLSLWFLLRLTDFTQRPSWSAWGWLTILAALACLQRYIGTSLVATGCLIIVLCLSEVPLLRRLLWAVALGVGSLAPVSVWTIRNYRMSGLWTGTRDPSKTPLLVNLRRTYETTVEWFSPYVGPVVVTVLAVAIFVIALLVVAHFVFGWRRATPPTDRTRTETSTGGRLDGSSEDAKWAGLGVLVAFVCTYLASLMYANTTVDLFPIGGRGLAPVYVPVMCLAFILVDWVVWYTATLKPAWLATVARIFIIALTGFALIFPLRESYAYIRDAQEDGIEGYTSRETYKTPILKWLRNNRLAGTLYTNEGWKLALVTGRIVHWVPPTAGEVRPFLDEVLAEVHPESPQQGSSIGPATKERRYLVWFDRGRGARWRSGRVREAFVASGRAQLIKEATGGAVYLLDE